MLAHAPARRMHNSHGSQARDAQPCEKPPSARPSSRSSRTRSWRVGGPLAVTVASSVESLTRSLLRTATAVATWSRFGGGGEEWSKRANAQPEHLGPIEGVRVGRELHL